MISLIKDEIEIKEKFPDSQFCYKYIVDDKVIGLASINKNNEDKVYIFIKKELRGNGYGKNLFSDLIDELYRLKYKEIKVKFNKDNIQMLKIVKFNGGIHISSDNGVERYLIPLRAEIYEER